MTVEEKAHILVVDDDDRLRMLLKKFLCEQGFLVTGAADSAEARRKMSWFAFDVIVLDVMMPGESGVELLQSLPEEKKGNVLMLSAMGEAEDRVRGLESGAQDYLVKPFEPKELVLRIRTILRRAAPPKGMQRVTFGDFEFDMARGQLKKGADAVYLTTGETALLKRLAEHAGKPVPREELAGLLGGGNERTVDVQITRLRKKIEEEGRPLHLQTVRGAGYVLYADKEGV
ncbi:MAG: response regulator [Proteobacteria bacterium]|nr:response regulator [Pseudomonadota bacterium]